MSSASITTSGVGNDLGVATRHVSSGIGVDGSVDQPHRHRGLTHGAHPAVAICVPVTQKPSDLVQHPLAVVVFEDLVETTHQLARGLGVRAEHLVDGRLQYPPRQWAALQRAHDVSQRRSRHQLLHGARRVGLVEQATVEPGDRLIAHRSIGMFTEFAAGQQFLAHRVAEVVREHVAVLDVQVLEQRLVHVRVVGHRVAVGDGLGRKAHADHVGCDDGEPLDQRGPDQRPVP